MPSTYTGGLGLEKPATGEQSGTWGDTANDNYDILDIAINGSKTITLAGTSSSLVTTDGAVSDGQYKLLVLAGSPPSTHTITISPNTSQKVLLVYNTTGQSVILTQGSGGNVTIAAGDSAIIYANGAGVTAAVANFSDHLGLSSVRITGGSIDGTTVGATTPSTGAFTTLSASGVATFGLGAVAAPSITVTGDPNTGLWSPGADILALSTGGTERLRVSTSAVTSTLPVLIPDGAVGAPSVAFADDTNTGIWSPSNDNLAVSTAGAERVRVDASGNVGVGGTAATTAILDIISTTKGFRAPSMTTVQRDAIVSPATGLLIYNTTLNFYQVYNGTSWTSVGGGATGGGTDQIFWENGQTVTTNYTISNNKNAMSAGPITINSGITVTVGDGEVWTIV
jgi:hypothetical protein